MLILVQCRQFKIHGHAALSSDEYMRARRDRSIPRQMKDVWKISNAGNEEKAIQVAQQKLEQCEREGKKKPSEMCPGTTVHRLVGEIKGKVYNTWGN